MSLSQNKYIDQRPLTKLCGKNSKGIHLINLSKFEGVLEHKFEILIDIPL